MDKDLKDRIVWAEAGIITAGTMGGLAGFLLSDPLNLSKLVGTTLGFLGFSSFILLNQFGTPLYKPARTMKELMAQANTLRKQKPKIYDAGKMPESIIKQTTKLNVFIEKEGRGYLPEFELEEERLQKISFYLAFWPKNKWRISVPFLKNETKLMTEGEVKKFQEVLVSYELARPNEKGREGHKGYELLNSGKSMFRHLGLQYSPTPQDKERFNVAFRRHT